MDFLALEPQDQGNPISGSFSFQLIWVFDYRESVTVKFEHMASMVWECSNSLSPNSYYIVYKYIFPIYIEVFAVNYSHQGI